MSSNQVKAADCINFITPSYNMFCNKNTKAAFHHAYEQRPDLEGKFTRTAEQETNALVQAYFKEKWDAQTDDQKAAWARLERNMIILEWKKLRAQGRLIENDESRKQHEDEQKEEEERKKKNAEEVDKK